MRPAALILFAALAAGAEPPAAPEPTPAEVECLHLVNRFRADPAGEGLRLLHGARLGHAGSPDGIDIARCRAEFALLKPVPPLAMDLRLLAAARGHAAWLLANGATGHDQIPGSPGFTGADPLARMRACGFAGAPGAENCFAGSASPANAVCGYVIDWGAGEGQLLPGRPHRRNLLIAEFDAVGGAMLPRPGGFASVQNLGRTRGGRLLGGVVYRDRDQDGRFDAGEGVGGVAVAAGGVETATWASGGWSLQLPEGAAGEVAFRLGSESESAPLPASGAVTAVDWPIPSPEDLALLARLEAAVAGEAALAARARADAAVLLTRLSAPRQRVAALAAACTAEREALRADQEAVREAVWWQDAAPARTAAAAAGARWRGGAAAAWFTAAADFAVLHGRGVELMQRIRAQQRIQAELVPNLKRDLAQLRRRLPAGEWPEACAQLIETFASLVPGR